MRLTSWLDCALRGIVGRFGVQHRRPVRGVRNQASAFVESLETRCPLSAGDLDPSFGVGGRVTTSFEISASATNMALQSDGKIVVVGYSSTNFVLARYNDDGSLDTSFDGDGKLTTDLGPRQAFANSVAVQLDGKIVVAGVTDNGIDLDFALVRYNSDGSLDTSFDGDGKLTTDFGTGAGGTGQDQANSVVIQTDGKIVVVGSNSRGYGDFAMARHNDDGSLDTSFDGDGKLTTDFGTQTDRA